jgi:predicted DNA-binding transcriptional regulator YafY
VKADRLLSILLLLQARGRMTAADLAARLEVAERTIRRDVDALSAAGVPVYAERGRAGGYALVDGFRTEATGLTPDEARALFAFAGGGVAGDLGYGNDLAAALRKIAAALPTGLAEAITGPGTAPEHVLVEGRPWLAGPPSAALPALRDAVWQGRRLRLGYRSAGAVSASERTVDPLGLAARAGNWYLVALDDGAPRLFRVDRVEAASILDEPARRPAGFDLRRTWEALTARFDQRPDGITVVARVDAAMIATVERICGRAIEGIDAGDPDGPDVGDGARGAIVRFRYPGPEAARGALLGFGDALEVLEPPSVRDEMARAARAVVDRYAGRPGTPVRQGTPRRHGTPRRPVEAPGPTV